MSARSLGRTRSVPTLCAISISKKWSRPLWTISAPHGWFPNGAPSLFVRRQALPPQEGHRPLVKNIAAGRACVDYSRVAGPMMAAREDQIQGNTIRPYSRLMIIKAWHILSPPLQDFPLAVCDGCSMLDDDVLQINYNKFGFEHRHGMLISAIASAGTTSRK